MVSLTFDEFHAIRNRQRATAEAKASAAAATTSNDHAPNSPLESDKPVGSKTTVAAATATSRARSNGTSDGEIAPTSGSVSAVCTCLCAITKPVVYSKSTARDLSVLLFLVSDAWWYRVQLRAFTST